LNREILIPQNINEVLNDRGQEKYILGVRSILDSYYDSNQIEHIVNQTNWQNEYSVNIAKNIGQRIKIPVEWFNDIEHYLNVLFGDLGRNVAFGEELFITNQVSELVQSIEIVEFTLDTFLEGLATILSRRNGNHSIEEIVVFLPLDYHNILFVNWINETQLLTLEPGTRSISFRGVPLRIIWSNKYNPFSSITFLNKHFGSWWCFPTVDNRLSIETRTVDENENIEVTVKTRFHFEISATENIRVYKVESE